MKFMTNKKNAAILAIAMCVCVALTGCQDVEANYDEERPSMFVVVEQTSSWRIVYQKDTKVMYAVSSSSYNYGDFTLLVNPDGTPMLWEGDYFE